MSACLPSLFWQSLYSSEDSRRSLISDIVIGGTSPGPPQGLCQMPSTETILRKNQRRLGTTDTREGTLMSTKSPRLWKVSYPHPPHTGLSTFRISRLPTTLILLIRAKSLLLIKGTQPLCNPRFPLLLGNSLQRDYLGLPLLFHIEDRLHLWRQWQEGFTRAIQDLSFSIILTMIIRNWRQRIHLLNSA